MLSFTVALKIHAICGAYATDPCTSIDARAGLKPVRATMGMSPKSALTILDFPLPVCPIMAKRELRSMVSWISVSRPPDALSSHANDSGRFILTARKRLLSWTRPTSASASAKGIQWFGFVCSSSKNSCKRLRFTLACTKLEVAWGTINSGIISCWHKDRAKNVRAAPSGPFIPCGAIAAYTKNMTTCKTTGFKLKMSSMYALTLAKDSATFSSSSRMRWIFSNSDFSHP